MNDSQDGRRYLFAIAINDYPAASGYEQLSNPILDCSKLTKVLKDKYGFEEILPPLTNENATRKEILKSLSNLELQAGDTLIVLFSGHGTEFGMEGHWAAFDSESGDEFTHVSASDVSKCLDKQVDARHIFLIVDCCFPDGIFKNNYVSRFPLNAQDDSRSRLALVSGRNTPVPEGNPGEHSPFAKALIGILEKYTSPLNVNKLLMELRDKFKGTGQVPTLDSLKLAAHEGGDFELVPIEYSLEMPDITELARAFYEIKYPNAWWDELEVMPSRFNVFTLRGKPFSGHMLAAKRFVRLFLNQSGHFECYSFSFGSNTLAVKGLWEEFGRQYNMQASEKADIVRVIYDKTLDKICVFFVEIPSGSQFPGVEGIIEEFWDEFQTIIKDIAAQKENEQAESKSNPFFLFIMDKRGLSDVVYRLKVKEPFANTVSPAPIPDFTLPVLNFWFARYQQNDMVFRGRFKELNFNTFEIEKGDFSPENTILKICEYCEFQKDNSPYQRIFYKHDEL